jgi:uncharacterized protein (TIGR02466 family)
MLTPLFSSFIYVAKLNLDNASMQSTVYDMEKSTPGILASNEGGWQSPSSTNQYGFENLMDEIRAACNQIHRDLGFKNSTRQEVGNFWLNINRDRDSNIPHSHPGSFFSGVYYIKAPMGCGSITLMHPVPAHTYTIPYGVNEFSTSFNNSTHIENPEEGKLIIFPSWLVHYVQPNRSNQDRISLAFNTILLDK